MIRSRSNRLFKSIRRMRRCKGDRVLLEGPHLVREAAEAGLALETVIATPEFLQGPDWRRLAEVVPQQPLLIRDSLLNELADADSPRGILAVARLDRHGVGCLPVQRGGVYLFLDGLQDPGNLGALARVAESVAAAGLALSSDSVSPNHPRALRASAGSLLRIPTAVNASPEELDLHLATVEPRWLGLVPRNGEDLYGASLSGTLVLAIGAEGPGLSSTLRRRCDLEVSIPTAPQVESLNATVAAAVVLFERRRRLAPGAS